jgi:hypothetical protein
MFAKNISPKITKLFFSCTSSVAHPKRLDDVRNWEPKISCLDPFKFFCFKEEAQVLDIQLEKDERGLGLTVAGYICQKGEY